MLLYEHENNNISKNFNIYLQLKFTLSLFTVNQWNYKMCFKFIKIPTSKLGLYSLLKVCIQKQ